MTVPDLCTRLAVTGTSGTLDAGAGRPRTDLRSCRSYGVTVAAPGLARTLAAKRQAVWTALRHAPRRERGVHQRRHRLAVGDGAVLHHLQHAGPRHPPHRGH